MAKSNKETFDNTYSGAQPPPLLPALRSDPQQRPPEATTLKSYREQESPQDKEKRLKALWHALPNASDEVIQWNADSKHPVAANQTDAERIEKLRQIYNQELVNRVGGGKAKAVDYNEFVKVSESTSERVERNEAHVSSSAPPGFLLVEKIQADCFFLFDKYAEAKEAELWSIFHDELDLDGNGKLDAYELRTALAKASMCHSATFPLSIFTLKITQKSHFNPRHSAIL